jgi:cellulose synthase/poly-beta-1,6-N-acetylglucosamine synthase-like glycosyltransferase
MLIGTVALCNEYNFFAQLQSIEFSSVIGTSIATCSLGKPTMCNGANLSFRKKIFDEVNGYAGNEHIVSGDDEFLMRKILAKYPKSISVLNPKENVVITQPQTSLKGFIQQRLRWASKWKINSSLTAKLFAVFIFTVQFSWLLFLTTMVFDFHSIGLSILFLKIIIDLLFLSTVCRSLKMKFHLIAFIALQFLYPVYVLYIGIFSQLRKYQWKGRTN